MTDRGKPSPPQCREESPGAPGRRHRLAQLKAGGSSDRRQRAHCHSSSPFYGSASPARLTRRRLPSLWGKMISSEELCGLRSGLRKPENSCDVLYNRCCGSRARCSSDCRVRPFQGRAASPRTSRRWLADQTRRTRFRRADGADRGVGGGCQQGRADAPRLGWQDRRGKQLAGRYFRAAQSLRCGSRSDPYGCGARLPIRRRDPRALRG